MSVPTRLTISVTRRSFRRTVGTKSDVSCNRVRGLTPTSGNYPGNRCTAGAASAWNWQLNSRIGSIPARLFRTLLLRGATLWFFARITAKAMLTVVSDAAGPLIPAWAIVMTAALTLVDLHRRKEVSLLNNLGIATLPAVIVATLPAILMEAVLVMLPS